ncbi:unnamed protein product, partial [Rhizoctonia solani]
RLVVVIVDCLVSGYLDLNPTILSSTTIRTYLVGEQILNKLQVEGHNLNMSSQGPPGRLRKTLRGGYSWVRGLVSRFWRGARETSQETQAIPRSEPQNLPPSTVPDPKTLPPWEQLDIALRAFESKLEVFPPLKAAVGMLVECLDVIKAAGKTPTGRDPLNPDEFLSVANILLQYTSELKLESGPNNGSIANIIQCIEREVEDIKDLKKRGTIGHLSEATRSQEDVIRRYRQISRLFGQLQCDLSMRINRDVKEQLQTTQLRGMLPVDDASLCEWLEKTNRLGASFFCSRISSTCRSLSRIVPTLAYQLARYSPVFRSALCAALKDNPDAGTLNVMQQFEKLVHHPILKVKDNIPESVVIVIDALDECNDKFSVRLLLDVLLKFAGELPLKFFVSSRPESQIRDRMMSQGGASRSIVHLHDIEHSIVENDIKKYLTEALSPMNPPPPHEQIEILAQRSRNLFIYAATLVRYIYPEDAHVDSNGRLKTMLATISDPKAMSANKYEELDRLYTTVLKAVFNKRLDGAEKQLLFWMEVLSLSHNIDTGAPVMQQAQAWLRTDSSHDKIQKQVSDARNFITWFAANPCSRSTPHIYISALPFCAKSSWVYQHYFQRTKGLSSISISHEEAILAVWSVESEVKSIAISPEGDHIASCHDDGSIQVYATHTGAVVVGSFQGHTRAINSVAFSPDGGQIVSGSSDNTVILWNTATGRLVAGPLHKHVATVYSVVFSPDGSHVVSGSADKTIIVWDNQTGAVVLGPLQGHSDEVRSVAFSPNGQLIASGSYDHSVRLWDVSTGHAAGKPFRGHTYPITMVAFSPDGSKLASSSWSQVIRVWDVQTGTVICLPSTVHKDSIYSIAFSPDSSRIASGGDEGDCSVMVSETLTGSAVLGPFYGHTAAVTSVQFFPDNTRLVSCSDDKTIRIWDTQPKNRLSGEQTAHEVSVGPIAFLPNHNQFISQSSNGSLQVWDVSTGAISPCHFKGQAKLGSLSAITVSSQGLRVAASYEDSTSNNGFNIQVWDALTGFMINQPLKGHKSSIKCLAFSPDGSHVCSGSDDSSVRVWDIEADAVDGRLCSGYHWHDKDSAVRSVTYSADGTRIASGGTDRTVRVWDPVTGMLIRTFGGHTSSVDSVIFSSNGSYLIAADIGGSIWGWLLNVDVSTIPTIIYSSKSSPKDRAAVSCVCFSPDGTLIIAGCGSTVRIFDAYTSEMHSVLSTSEEEEVRWVGFFPNTIDITSVSTPKKIVSGNSPFERLEKDSNIIRIWRTGSQALQKASSLRTSYWSCQPDGWILSPQGFLVWVPPDLLPYFRTKSGSYFNPFFSLAGGIVDFGGDDASTGDRWSECYIHEY